VTYLLGWNLDTDFLDSLGEFVWLHGAVVIQVKVLEGLHEHCLLGLSALGLLCQFVFQFSLETIGKG